MTILKINDSDGRSRPDVFPQVRTVVGSERPEGWLGSVSLQFVLERAKIGRNRLPGFARSGRKCCTRSVAGSTV
jgi:hypothetical protein